MRERRCSDRDGPAVRHDVVAGCASRGECRPGRCCSTPLPRRFQAPGGGENQLVQTGRHLEALGVPVRLFSAWTDRLETARLLHLFGMSREGLELAGVARARGVPVVLSPICWNEPRGHRRARAGSRAKAGEPGGVEAAADRRR